MADCSILAFQLFVVVDDGVHHVHHGFGGTEHGNDGVEPLVALEEIIRHLMPAAVVLLTQVVDILPVAREARRTGLQTLKSEALWLVPAGDISGRRKTGG